MRSGASSRRESPTPPSPTVWCVQPDSENLVAHAYESLDMSRVHQAATSGPSDLLRFLACLADRSRQA
jgi:hypothetical protein